MFMHRPVVSAYESHLSTNDWYYIKNAVHPSIIDSKKYVLTIVIEDNYATDTTKFRLDVSRKGDRADKTKRYSVATLEELVQMINAIGLLEH